MKTKELYESPESQMVEVDSEQMFALSYGNDGEAGRDMDEDYYYGSF